MLRRVCHRPSLVKPIVGRVALPLSACLPTPLGSVLAAGPGPNIPPKIALACNVPRLALAAWSL